MIETVKIDKIKPADYNPRRINAEQFEKLKQSLDIIGFSVPILVNRKNNVIIAGHQRTKAARAIGIHEVPAIKIDNVSAGDEIKFNQLHNGVDAQRGFECNVNTDGLPISLRVRASQRGTTFCQRFRRTYVIFPTRPMGGRKNRPRQSWKKQSCGPMLKSRRQRLRRRNWNCRNCAERCTGLRMYRQS